MDMKCERNIIIMNADHIKQSQNKYLQNKNNSDSLGYEHCYYYVFSVFDSLDIFSLHYRSSFCVCIFLTFMWEGLPKL